MRRNAPRDASTWLAAGLLLPAYAMYTLFVLWPIVQVLWLSLYRWDGYGPQQWVGAANFMLLVHDSPFLTALAHSVFWEVAAVIAPTVLGLGLAILIEGSHIRRLSVALLFFPALLPPTAVAALWILFLSPLSGPLNTFLHLIGMGFLAQDWLGDPRLVLPSLFTAWLWASLGVSTLLFRVGLSAIACEYMELAEIEGAGALWRFVHVTVPALRRTFGIMALMNAALGSQVFDLIFVTTGGGPGDATMTLPLDMYGRAFNGRVGEGAAAAGFQLLLGLVLAAISLALARPAADSFQSTESQRLTTSRHMARWPATAALSVLLVALLFPLVWLCTAAIAPGRSLTLAPSRLFLDPRSWTGANVEAVWRTGMGAAIERSTLIASTTVIVTAFLAVPAAFALAHLVRWNRVRVALAALLIVGLLQPTPVLIIPLFSLIRNLKLLGTEWGIVVPEVARSMPLAILLFWSWFRETPTNVFEAAEVDGASSLTQFTRIALPLARPAVLAFAVWVFVGSWNEYLLPTLILQDGTLQTVPTLLRSYIGTYNTQFGLLAAGTMLAISPSAAVYVFLRRAAAAGLAPVEHSVR
ncbi:MAG: hypothetical protein PVSMB7_16380 [Chloroflexota bacterium]